MSDDKPLTHEQRLKRIKMHIRTTYGTFRFRHDNVIEAERFYREEWIPATHQIARTHPIVTAEKNPQTGEMISPLVGTVVPWEDGKPVEEKAISLQVALAAAKQRQESADKARTKVGQKSDSPEIAK